MNTDEMLEAAHRGLSLPGGSEIAERVREGLMSLDQGMIALLVLSGEYKRTENE